MISSRVSGASACHLDLVGRKNFRKVCTFQSGKLKSIPISVISAIFNLPLHQVNSCRYYCNQRSKRQTVFSFPSDRDRQFELDCKTLEVPETCDENQVRSSFIRLTKVYHPDAHGPESSAEKFHELDTAYKNVLKKFADERHNHSKLDGEYGLYFDSKKHKKTNNQTDNSAKTEDNFDIQHTAPQHRQFLTFDGFTAGSPYQREKQYEKFRASKAAGNVHDHRIKKLTQNSGAEETAVAKDQRAARKIKTSFGMDRLVEDMIQESMARGDFDNLSCSGKPLKHDSSYNPYIDFTTHKLNQVLIENGFAPEWILLEKEIRQEIRNLRSSLQTERHSYDVDLTSDDLSKWEKYLSDLKPSVDVLNSKIQKYNLIVPSLFKQILCVELNKEGKKALAHFSEEIKNQIQIKNSAELQQKQMNAAKLSEANGSTFVGLLMSLVKPS